MVAMIEPHAVVHVELDMDEVMVLLTIASTLTPSRYESPQVQAVIKKARKVSRQMRVDPEHAIMSVRVY